jgi:hypothetical protein
MRKQKFSFQPYLQCRYIVKVTGCRVNQEEESQQSQDFIGKNTCQIKFFISLIYGLLLAFRAYS